MPGLLHFNVDGPGLRATSLTLQRAFWRVARAEAHRLAGNDWALWIDSGRILVQRQGSTSVAKFRTWAEVARFLKALQDAGRTPLVSA